MGVSLIVRAKDAVVLEMVHAENLWPFNWVGKKILFYAYFVVKKIKN